MTTETNDTPPGDPMEHFIAAALDDACIAYVRDLGGANPSGLDFRLIDSGIEIEVKRFHSPRIADQMARATDAIAVQGEKAVRFFAALLSPPQRAYGGVKMDDPKEMVELLPCPFCGATSDLLLEAMTRASDDLSWWSVECTRCGVEVADDESQEAANRHWNTRAPAADREKLVRAVVERCAAEADRRHPVGGDGCDPYISICYPGIASAIRSLNIDDLVKEAGK